MVSPPPARLKPLALAMAIETVLVPAPNWSNSNTPTGPFQTMVPAWAMMSASCCADCGPMSKIMSSSVTWSAALRTAGSAASNFLPQTTSTAIGIEAPRLAIFSISILAVGIRSCSHSDLPTFWPMAARKVLAMPPPTTSWSTLSESDSSTVSLVDTFEPPTMATIGRAGLASALSSASSSSVSSRPAQATGANCAMP